MPTPTIRAPQVQAERGPTVFQNPGETQGAFGEGPARALAAGGAQLAQALDPLAEADHRLKLREDAITRTREMSALEQAVQQLVLAEETGSNFMDSKSTAKTRQQIDARIDSSMQQHAGVTRESAALFREQAEAYRGKIASFIVERGVQAGRAAMNERLKTVVNNLADTVSGNPEALPDALAQAEAYIQTDYGPTMRPDDEATATQAARETLAVASIDYHLAAGNYLKAREVMASPAVAPYLSASVARNLRLQAFTGEGAAAKLKAEINVKLGVLKDAGIELSPAQRAQAYVALATGVNLSGSKTETLAGKINELTTTMRVVTGNPNWAPNESQVLKVGNALVASDDEADPYKSKGTMRRFLDESAEAFAAGSLSPAGDRAFISMYQAMTSTDEVTKQRATASPVWTAALARRGIDATRVATGDPRGVEMTQRAIQESIDRERQAGQQPALTEPGATTPAPAPAPAGPGASTQPAPAGPSAAPGSMTDLRPRPQDEARVGAEVDAVITKTLGPTAKIVRDVAASAPSEGGDPTRLAQALAGQGINFYRDAHLLTGMFASMAQRVSGTFLLGKVIEAPETRDARLGLTLFQPLVADFIRLTPRYADAERQDIQARLGSLEGNFFHEPRAMITDLKALDKYVAIGEAYFRDIVETEGRGTVSAERLKYAKDQLSKAILVRSLAGVPPLVATEEELYRVIRERGLKEGDLVNWKGTVFPIRGSAPSGGAAQEAK